MSFLRCILFLPFAAALVHGQSTSANISLAPRDNPTVPVAGLYHQVVMRHPYGLPGEADEKAIAPYISNALFRKIGDARACSEDWDKHSPNPELNTKMASESRLFSGGDRVSDAQSFHIGSTRSLKDNSQRVVVSFSGNDTFGQSWTWRVAAIVIQEGGSYVVDDVVYINDSSYEYAEDKPANRKLSGYLAAGCDGPHWAGYRLPEEPSGLVESLYQQVLIRTPGGVPRGEDWKIFAPYMSKALLKKIEDFNACVADWQRTRWDPKNPEKAPFGIFESGMFSGGDERTGPRAFRLERTQQQKDGSVRVYIKLSWWDAPAHKRADDFREFTSADHPVIWRVAAVVGQEGGRSVITDVIYLKDKADPRDTEGRLSKSLSYECKGPRWVGYDQFSSVK